MEHKKENVKVKLNEIILSNALILSIFILKQIVKQNLDVGKIKQNKRKKAETKSEGNKTIIV